MIETSIPPGIDFRDLCSMVRKRLKDQEMRLRTIMRDRVYRTTKERFLGQHGEMEAQTMLAIRHVEDAQMRVGKILQYADSETNIFDKY